MGVTGVLRGRPGLEANNNKSFCLVVSVPTLWLETKQMLGERCGFPCVCF